MLTKTLVLTALLGSVALPALAGPSNNCAVCACPPAQVHPVARHVRAMHRAARSYAGAFYDYGAAYRVPGGFRAGWVEAPHDGHVGGDQQQMSYNEGYDEGYYAPAAYGPEDLTGTPDLNRGWSGGVGHGGDGGGGGGGGYGGATAILAGGQNGNGPSYNSYNQSFPYGGADTYAAQVNAGWRASGIPIQTSK